MKTYDMEQMRAFMLDITARASQETISNAAYFALEDNSNLSRENLIFQIEKTQEPIILEYLSNLMVDINISYDHETDLFSIPDDIGEDYE